MSSPPLKSDEFVILAVLTDGELHGNEIMQAVYRKTGGGLIVRSSGLYRILNGLVIKKLIERIKKEPAPGQTAGRTYYRITVLGKHVVSKEIDKRAGR